MFFDIAVNAASVVSVPGTSAPVDPVAAAPTAKVTWLCETDQGWKPYDESTCNAIEQSRQATNNSLRMDRAAKALTPFTYRGVKYAADFGVTPMLQRRACGKSCVRSRRHVFVRAFLVCVVAVAKIFPVTRDCVACGLSLRLVVHTSPRLPLTAQHSPFPAVFAIMFHTRACRKLLQ